MLGQAQDRVQDLQGVLEPGPLPLGPAEFQQQGRLVPGIGPRPFLAQQRQSVLRRRPRPGPGSPLPVQPPLGQAQAGLLRVEGMVRQQGRRLARARPRPGPAAAGAGPGGRACGAGGRASPPPPSPGPAPGRRRPAPARPGTVPRGTDRRGRVRPLPWPGTRRPRGIRTAAPAGRAPAPGAGLPAGSAPPPRGPGVPVPPPPGACPGPCPGPGRRPAGAPPAEAGRRLPPSSSRRVRAQRTCSRPPASAPAPGPARRAPAIRAAPSAQPGRAWR